MKGLIRGGSVLLAGALTVCLVGCEGVDLFPNSATLYTDMELDIGSTFVTHEFSYTGPLTATKLAEGLGDLTGLDYIVTESGVEGGVVIDWSPEATLIKNFGDEAQDEDFYFEDSASMQWFMLESLWKSIIENFPDKEVYYTMNGGNDLYLAELYPVSQFAGEYPYLGLSYYLEQSVSEGIEAPATDAASGMSQEEAESLITFAMILRGQVFSSMQGNGSTTLDGINATIYKVEGSDENGEATFDYAVADNGFVYYKEGDNWHHYDIGSVG